ncbi:DUF6896 domain-containing protein [Streptomyces rochei]|uniref:DUF6896 domain-containing protein n=1 Tax=Streptomyces rochei TaxID=1928 RepID=A0ABW7DTI8_STRRO
MSDASAEVAEYVEALAAVESAVLRSIPDLGASLASILAHVRAGRMPKAGELSTGIEYLVHGNGCLFVSNDGREVDVDFLADGTPIFDAWRINRLALSRGSSFRVAADEIVRECRKAVSSGLFEEVTDGWFAVRREAPNRST